MALVKFHRRRPYGYGYDLVAPRTYSRSEAQRSDNLTPSADIHETEKDILIRVELPGIEKKNVDITFKDSVLTIKGEKNDIELKEDENRYFNERRFGSFERSFRFSVDVQDDKINASFKNGVLTITVPKAPVPEPVKIMVK